MYIPNAYRQDDIEQLIAFMRAYSFVTLVSSVDSVPVASHIPVIVSQQGGNVTLTGHLARANPQWQAFGNGEALAIFAGPHAYVSPVLYERRESVPTWNYIAVHAYGIPQTFVQADAPEALDEIIVALIEANDPSYRQQWDELSGKYREGMLNGIVGFEMRVTRLHGKYKLSQNRSHADQSNIAQALLQNDDPTIASVGMAMRQNLEVSQ